MKNLSNYCVLLFCIISVSGYSQGLDDGLWKIKSSSVLYDGDTINLYRINQPDNTFDLSQISYDFNTDGSYIGTSVDGTEIIGEWSVSMEEITIDNKVAAVQFLDNEEFIISSNFSILDTSGIIQVTESLLHFYNLESTSTYNVDPDLGILGINPNPFAEFIEIQMLSTISFNLEIEIRDLLGRIMLVEQLNHNNSINRFIIETSNIPAGNYCLIVKSPDSLTCKKIVKTWH